MRGILVEVNMRTTLATSSLGLQEEPKVADDSDDGSDDWNEAVRELPLYSAEDWDETDLDSHDRMTSW
jgi:hypothetical protein